MSNEFVHSVHLTFSQNLPDLSQMPISSNFVDIFKAHTKGFNFSGFKSWPEKEKRVHLLKGS